MQRTSRQSDGALILVRTSHHQIRLTEFYRKNRKKKNLFFFEAAKNVQICFQMEHLNENRIQISKLNSCHLLFSHFELVAKGIQEFCSTSKQRNQSSPFCAVNQGCFQENIMLICCLQPTPRLSGAAQQYLMRRAISSEVINCMC